MTTVHSAPPPAAPPPLDHGPGVRLRRLQKRRRLVREELLAVAVLVIALAVTLTVLALQWLDSGPTTVAAAVTGLAHTQTYAHTQI